MLEGGAYSNLVVNGAAHIRGWCLCKAQRLLEEIRYVSQRKIL